MHNGEKSGADMRDIKFHVIEYAALSEAKPEKSERVNQDSHLEFQKDGLFVAIVADGIGGEPGGEIASKLAIAASKEVADRAPKTQPLQEILTEMIETGDTDIRDIQKRSLQYKTMGTTFAGIAVRGNEFASANVGDSRIYRKRGATWGCLSEDHTVGAEMLAKGASQQEAAKKDHVITRYIGYGPKQIKPCEHRLPIKSGEIFLLTSDGIHTRLTDQELFDLINEQDSAETITLKIMDAAKTKELFDDATVVVVKVK
ncbi:MAG: serine/threonine-protein phosphatase [Candidatus Magasanikbacteria bacterium]|nr:serine/threonine-protein phosphatase [Candidatus Magasanikbacteria bacterium]